MLFRDISVDTSFMNITADYLRYSCAWWTFFRQDKLIQFIKSPTCACVEKYIHLRVNIFVQIRVVCIHNNNKLWSSKLDEIYWGSLCSYHKIAYQLTPTVPWIFASPVCSVFWKRKDSFIFCFFVFDGIFAFERKQRDASQETQTRLPDGWVRYTSSCKL